MPRAYSLDLRDRVVAAVMSGRSCRAVAATFAVSVASAVKWTQRFRATGSAAAKPMRGRRPSTLVGQRDFLLARVAGTPHVTLRALRAELAQRGVVASYGAVWAFFAREGISFKKNLARQRTGAARCRPPAAAVESPSGPD